MIVNKTLWLVVGAPGSGKTYVCEKLKHKFHLIHHDGFIYLKEPGAYVKEILKEAPKALKPVLIEAPFSVSQTREPLEAAGYRVVPVYIVEDEETHSQRYLEREKAAGRWSEEKLKHLKGHLTRTKTYLERAKTERCFHGTSDEVYAYLRDLIL